MQLDASESKRKQGENDKSLSILCSRCTKKHPHNKCLFVVVKICNVCSENHDTINWPCFPGLKVMYQNNEKNYEHVYFINQRRFGHPRHSFHGALNIST